MIQNSLFTFAATRLRLYESDKSKNMEEEDQQCAMRIDFFTAPVRMTDCGHNYCQQCLTVMNETPWLCPECRNEQHQRPEQLARNFFLEKTVKTLIASRESFCATHNLQKKLCKYFIISKFEIQTAILITKTG